MLKLLRKIFKIHSPSAMQIKKGIEIGGWILEGMEKGMAYREKVNPAHTQGENKIG